MCDLTDPRTLEAYTAIIQNYPTNWLLLGYHDTRDVISLYSTGTHGLSEFRNHLINETLYGLIRLHHDQYVLVTWVPDQISDVLKARALVHSESVATLLKQHTIHIVAHTLDDMSEANMSNQGLLGVTETEDEEENQRLAKDEQRRKDAQQQKRLVEEEEQRILLEKEEAKILQERLLKETEKENRRLQLKLLETEKNKHVILSGFVSVQPNTNPFWRRRYFVLQGKCMAFYKDERQHDLVSVLDLNDVKKLRTANVDMETFLPNAFILETQLNGYFQLFADNEQELQAILSALHSVVS